MRVLIRTIRAYLTLTAHLLVIFFNVLYGIWRISKLKSAPVSIFGGSRLKPDSVYITQAHELAHLLASHNIPVLTGGGPGIMEAANCGAFDARGDGHTILSMGIGVKGLSSRESFNTCAQNTFIMRDFFSRKWLLINYSRGFAVFPGGFGTLDELNELLTLLQTNMRVKAPIVLIGTSYWKTYMNWILNSAQAHNLVTQEDCALFTVTDHIEEAFELLKGAESQEPFSIFT